MERLHRYEPICRARFPTGLQKVEVLNKLFKKTLVRRRHIQALGEW